MLRNGSRHWARGPPRGRLARERREPVVVQRVARERPAEVRAALPQAGMERVRALHVLLFEVLVVLGRRDVEPAVRDDAAALDRVLVGMRERDQLAFDRALRELEAGGPTHRLERRLARPLERFDDAPAARAASARGRSRRRAR